MHMLSVSHLSYDYFSKAGVTHALKDITADFSTGRMYALTGRSGSGKTTFLSLLADFDRPKEGKILLNGTDIQCLNPEKYRRECIGLVFQSYNLVNHLSAEENVMIPLALRGIPRKERRGKAQDYLLRAGVNPACFSKRPNMLSGGEQQRVAIARAIASDAPVILADEPTGNLDTENSTLVFELLKSLAHEQGKCVIVVTHSEEIASKADVCLHMKDGKITMDNFDG